MNKRSFNTVVRIVTTLLVFVYMASCNEKGRPLSRDEIVKRNLKEYVLPGLEHPDTYELLSLVIYDTVYYKDNIKQRKAMFKSNLNRSQQELGYYESHKNDFEADVLESRIARKKGDISLYKNIISSIDSVETQMGDTKNEVASFTYLISYRYANNFGVKNKYEGMIQTGPEPDFKIINITNDTGKLFVIPNGFPGYDQIIYNAFKDRE